jgi:hypothetical protein
MAIPKTTKQIEASYGPPSAGETCLAVMDLDGTLCGEPATKAKLFCGMRTAFCDDHAAEMDEMTDEEKGNDV